MNVNDMTFGIEIETTIPAGAIAVGPHGMGYSIPQLPGWLADRDPSIHRTSAREACEFISPVFGGPAGLSQLLADLATIRGLGASVNSSCGLHIHIGFDKRNEETSAKLATLVSNFEKLPLRHPGRARSGRQQPPPPLGRRVDRSQRSHPRLRWRRPAARPLARGRV